MRDPWRRVLYEKQHYPDNYIDADQFLNVLFDDPIQEKLSFSILALHATVVIFHYVLVVLFLVIYKGAYFRYEEHSTMPENGSPFNQLQWLININASFFVVSILVYFALQAWNPTHDVVGTLLGMLKKGVIIGIYLRLAAPVLSVLTSSFSDDTIYALVIFFSAVHLAFFDYCYQKGNENDNDKRQDSQHLSTEAGGGGNSPGPVHMPDKVGSSSGTGVAVATVGVATFSSTNSSGSARPSPAPGSSADTLPAASSPSSSVYVINNVSLNAAMLTTILLASRLQNLSVVLLLILFAIILFCVLPHVIGLIYVLSPELHLLCTLGIATFTGRLLLERQRDAVLFNIYIMILVFMWVVCPALLVYMSHTHKRNNRRIHTGDLC